MTDLTRPKAVRIIRLLRHLALENRKWAAEETFPYGRGNNTGRAGAYKFASREVAHEFGTYHRYRRRGWANVETEVSHD